MIRVLVIEENDGARKTLLKALQSAQLQFSPDAEQAIGRLQNETFDVVILDLPLRQDHDTRLLRKLRDNAPYTPVIVTSESQKAELIVKVVKAGAVDFIVKPYTPDKVQLAVKLAVDSRTLRNEIDYLRRQQDVVYDFDKIIAVSRTMQKVIATIKKLAHADSTILMTGETGTGKSMLSGTIHYNSIRRDRPFVKINCANIPETLLESELFGHEKGAFTGANKTRMGRLEQANGGTVFLDEIGELSPPLQAKFLRVLEEKSFERLGGNRTIHSNIRIIAATNRDLENLVGIGAFREDLYYRLNVIRMHLPPLRERVECIESLAYYHLDKICRSVKKRIEGFSPEAVQLLSSYPWPGNIRELSNTIERAALLEDTSLIQAESISFSRPITAPVERKPVVVTESSQTLDEQEKSLVLEALEKSLWIQKDAANLLGISPRILNYKVKKYGITHPRWRKNRGMLTMH